MMMVGHSLGGSPSGNSATPAPVEVALEYSKETSSSSGHGLPLADPRRRRGTVATSTMVSHSLSPHSMPDQRHRAATLLSTTNSHLPQFLQALQTRDLVAHPPAQAVDLNSMPLSEARADPLGLGLPQAPASLASPLVTIGAQASPSLPSSYPTGVTITPTTQTSLVPPGEMGWQGVLLPIKAESPQPNRL